ncbi:DotU family type VI secretion system protein [soil metagenome]
MPEDDPFAAFESDRTIIKPSAGRARATSGTPPGAAAATTLSSAPSTTTTFELKSSLDGAALPELPPVAGFSPLLQAATPLLRAAPRIRTMPRHPNPAALRAALIDGVRQFDSACRTAGLPNEQVVAGRYILCTVLDEAASRTPWGGSGTWSAQSLLVTFHSESWGGEKVFQLLAKLAEDVPRHRHLLELLYAVLALGFEGRYGVLDNGQAQLDAVRERLAGMLRPATGSHEKELSPHWAGVARDESRVRDGVPVWVVAAGAALALMLVFVGLRFSIQDRSDPSFAALQALDVAPVPAAPMAAPIPAAAPRLSGFLKPDIDAGLVEVRDLADRSLVIIRGDGVFDAGSATVTTRFEPLLERIAGALNKVPGQVLVTGHTDNQPIRSLRYPSNWHLSQERAASVRTRLASGVDAQRGEQFKAEGRADGEPVEGNDTAAGRARNRRVEITLMAPQGS